MTKAVSAYGVTFYRQRIE